MSIPVLNFQPYNPMDNLIQSALGVYGGINQGKQQEAQREMWGQQQALIAQQIQNAQAELPYIGKTKEAQLGLINAQTQEHQQNAAKQRQVLDAINKILNPQNGQNSGNMGQPAMAGQQGAGLQAIPGQSQALPINSQANPYAGSGALQSPMGTTGPRMQQNPGMQAYPGPSQDIVMARQLIGMPGVLPDEQIQIDLWKEGKKKSMEQFFPTTQTISDTQNRLKGIEGTLPIIEDLLNIDVPHQVGTPNPFGEGKFSDIFAAEKQAEYEGKLANAMESYLAAIGQKPTSEGLHVVEKALGRKAWESEEAYKKRLKNEFNTIINTYERLGGEKGKYLRKDEQKLEDPLGIR